MTTRNLSALALLVILLGGAVAGHTAEPAKAKIVPFWTDKAPGAKGEEDQDRPTLTVHLPDPSKATGTGVIVCPGGGYTILVADHEGQQVAKWLNSVGIAAFVLNCGLSPASS